MKINMGLDFDFSGIKDKAANAAGAAKKKATVLAGIAKANVSIYAEEDKIKKAEAELGRLYYNDFVTGNAADTEAYQPICDRITESKNTIQDLKAAIAALKAQAAAEAAVDEDEVTDADFVVSGEEAAEEPAEEPAEEAPAAEEPAPEEPVEAPDETPAE